MANGGAYERYDDDVMCKIEKRILYLLSFYYYYRYYFLRLFAKRSSASMDPA
jgi:hypothetical protein